MRKLAPSMVWAVLIIVLSVLGGTLLALLPQGKRRLLGPVRTFAFSAALGVVGLHMLPEALLELGIWALLVLPFGWMAPEVLGRLGALAARGAQRQGTASHHLALEASYFGLLLHRVGDGIGLGLYTGELSHGDGSGGVVAALSTHAVPVVAIVVLTFDSVRGRESALRRAVGLAGASVVGVLLTQTVLAESVLHASGAIAAFVSGMLLHVVSHELRLQLPRTTSEKGLDLIAAISGLLTSLLGVGSHAHAAPSGASQTLFGALLRLGQSTLPFLAFGAVVVLLVALALRRWSRSRWVWGFLSAQAAPEALVLTLTLLGPLVAVGRLMASVLSAATHEPKGVAGRHPFPPELDARPITRAVDPEKGDPTDGPVAPRSLFWLSQRMGQKWRRLNSIRERSRPSGARWSGGLVEAWVTRLEREVPYVLLALLLGANLEMALSPTRLSSIPVLVQVSILTLVGSVVRIPCGAVAVLGTALATRGLAAGALVTWLLLGPEDPLWRTARTSLGRAGTLLLAALGLAWLAESVGSPLSAPLELSVTVGGLSALALSFLIWGIWRRGLRAVFAELIPDHHAAHHHP